MLATSFMLKLEKKLISYYLAIGQSLLKGEVINTATELKDLVN